MSFNYYFHLILYFLDVVLRCGARDLWPLALFYLWILIWIIFLRCGAQDLWSLALSYLINSNLNYISLSCTIRVTPFPCIPVRSRSFPFSLYRSFMFPLLSVPLLLCSVPLSVTPSYFHFRLRPWRAQSTDWALSSVGLYFILLLFMSPYTSVPFR